MSELTESPIVSKHKTSPIEKITVEISDALYDEGKLEFVVKSHFERAAAAVSADYEVKRVHSEFEWLYFELKSNSLYNGLIIPSKPIRPDLRPLEAQKSMVVATSGENGQARDLAAEVEQESTAMFRRAVVTHERFLKKLTSNRKYMEDPDFHVFLTFSGPLNIRSRNNREFFMDSLKAVVKTADEIYITSPMIRRSGPSLDPDPNGFFESNHAFLSQYHSRVLDANRQAEAVIRSDAGISRCFKKLETNLDGLEEAESRIADSNATKRKPTISPLLLKKLNVAINGIRMTETVSRCHMQEQLSDSLRNIKNETRSALDVVYQRSHCLAELDRANRNLDGVSLTNDKNGVMVAEKKRLDAKQKVQAISMDAKAELEKFSNSGRLSEFCDHVKILCQRQTELCDAEASTIGVLIFSPIFSTGFGC